MCFDQVLPPDLGEKAEHIRAINDNDFVKVTVDFLINLKNFNTKNQSTELLTKISEREIRSIENATKQNETEIKLNWIFSQFWCEWNGTMVLGLADIYLWSVIRFKCDDFNVKRLVIQRRKTCNHCMLYRCTMCKCYITPTTQIKN